MKTIFDKMFVKDTNWNKESQEKWDAMFQKVEAQKSDLYRDHIKRQIKSATYSIKEVQKFIQTGNMPKGHELDYALAELNWALVMIDAL